MRMLAAGGAVALGVLAVGAGAGIEHTALHGAEIGRVYVSYGPDEVPGLSRDALQTGAESQLREAGIEITPDAPAYLLVSVRVFTGPACFADIKSSLVEDALLERNGLRVEADSWQTGGSAMLVSLDECARLIPGAVEGAVGDFVEVYGAMNPKG